MRAESLELAAGAAREYDDLVVLCVVRLHRDEPACLLLHWNLLSSPDIAATVPRDGPALHSTCKTCARPRPTDGGCEDAGKRRSYAGRTPRRLMRPSPNPIQTRPAQTRPARIPKVMFSPRWSLSKAITIAPAMPSATE